MKKYLASLCSLILAALPCLASYTATNQINQATATGLTHYLGGTFPFTIAGWNIVPSAGGQDMFVSGKAGTGGWILAYDNTCSGGGAQIVFTKFTVVELCSTLTATTSAWTGIGAVVSSSQVHFLTMSANGQTVNTHNVSNSSAITSPGSSAFTAISDNSSATCSGCSFAYFAVWTGVALSDAEIEAYLKTCSPQAIGRAVTEYIPLHNVASSSTAQGNLSSGGTLFTLNTPNGTGSWATGNNPPCGNPFGGF